MTSASHKIQYGLITSLFFFMKKIPLTPLSNVMGKTVRFIGPMLPSSHIARVNLHLAFPHISPQERDLILRECWENIGRSLAEFPHIPTLPYKPTLGPGWYIDGEEWLAQAKQSGRPIIFFSGHIGNWEIMPTALAHFGLPFASFYRAPNNPYINQLLAKQRQKNIHRSGIPMFPKGAKGARAAMRYLASGGHLGILGDQKMNDGICAQFFNCPTMTAPAAAALALKFNALIVPGYVRRESAGRLILHVNPPLDPHAYAAPSESRQVSIQRITQLLNDRLEAWITQYPGSWLWLHRRWQKDLYR